MLYNETMALEIQSYDYEEYFLNWIQKLDDSSILDDDKRLNYLFHNIQTVFTKNPIKVYRWVSSQELRVFSNFSYDEFSYLKAKFRNFYRDFFKRRSCDHTNFYFSLFSEEIFNSKWK